MAVRWRAGCGLMKLEMGTLQGTKQYHALQRHLRYAFTTGVHWLPTAMLNCSELVQVDALWWLWDVG